MANKKEQIELGEELQMLLLEDYKKVIKSGAATAADRAALGKLLQNNGWSIDPADIPKEVKDYLTKRVDPRKFEDDDPDIRVN